MTEERWKAVRAQAGMYLNMFLKSILNKILQSPLIIFIHKTLNSHSQPPFLKHTQRLRVQKFPHQIFNPNDATTSTVFGLILPVSLLVLREVHCCGSPFGSGRPPSAFAVELDDVSGIGDFANEFVAEPLRIFDFKGTCVFDAEAD